MDYYNVRVLLKELVNLRKNAPQLIFDVYIKYNKDIMRSLECVKINLDNNGEFNNCIIDSNYLLDNLNMKQDNELLQRTYEQIQLLQILIKKKNCPISKIIDDI